jgi:signal transduction histidine kinase
LKGQQNFWSTTWRTKFGEWRLPNKILGLTKLQRPTFFSQFRECVTLLYHSLREWIWEWESIIRNFKRYHKFVTDWGLYELILFNFIQNSVKFANRDGEILVVLDCEPSNSANSISQFEYKTTIVDTGCGIEKERQNYIFHAFKELRIN